MFERLKGIINNSYSNISNFKVACIVEMCDGKTFEGVNVENPSFKDGQIVVPKCEEHCNWCSYNEYDKKATFKCDEIIEKSKNGEITDANAISMILGKVCIMSECGWIPDRIVDKLSEMSRFFCNHMG